MPKTILLADDSITIQKVVGITFATEDFKITAVDNGEDALRKAREIRPDIILADVVMPRKNGYELCEAVKTDPELKSTPVLLLAGTFEAFDENRARGVQADGHIAKPFDSQSLITKVKELLQIRGGAPAPQPTVLAPAAAPAPAPPVAGQRPVVSPPVAPPAGTVARPAAFPLPGRPARPQVGQPPGSAARPGAPGAPPASWIRPGVAPVPGARPRPSGPIPPGIGPRAPIPAVPPRPGMVGPGMPGLRPPMPGAMAPGVRPPQAPPGRVGAPAGARGSTPAPFPPRPAPVVRPPTAAPESMAARPAPPAARHSLSSEDSLLVDPFSIEVPSAPVAPPSAAPVSLEDDWSDLNLGGSAPAPVVPKPPPSSAPTVEPLSGLAAAFQEPATVVTGHKPRPVAPAVPLARSADGGEAQLREALSQASREVIERIAWEVVPPLAETIIREQIDRLVKERQGQ